MADAKHELPTSPELAYNIASMRLTGTVDGTAINTIAYSGGRAGSKTPGAINNLIANNPFLTGVKLNEAKKKNGSVGGPLPMGTYTLVLHEKKENFIRLVPKNVTNMHSRSGFLIHGKGVRGSDGCIVPDEFSIVQALYKLVKERKEKNLPVIHLKVYAVGDLDFFQKNIEKWKHTV